MTDEKKMLVGVTGRAGSGKTTFARLLANEAQTYFADRTKHNRSEKPGSPNGYEVDAWGEKTGSPKGCEADARGQVIEADPLAWELYSKPDVKDNLVRAFGKGIFDPKGELCRSTLAGIVFSDREKLETLNSIIHPPLLAEIAARIERSRSKVVILDAALLLDWPIANDCSIKIAVLASSSVSLERLQSKGYPIDRARAILANQRPDAGFRRLCDVIVINNGSMEALAGKAKSTWCKRIAPLLDKL